MSTPTTMSMLDQLIAAPSMSSVNPDYDHSNLQVIELLEQWLSDIGFAVEISQVGDNRGKANLIARLGDMEDGLVLAGHADTVPYDPGRWQSDPFKLSERDGKLYGLGTSDMKGFFALIIEAASHFRANRLCKSLVVVATADEESSMLGAKALADRGAPTAPFAVIGEPTNMKPVRMHKGIAMRSIRVIGRSGHSSNPALGVNALEVMHTIIAALMQWRSQLATRYQHNGFQVPYPTVNLGVVRGGDNPNRICGECELQIDIRPLPGMQLAEIDLELVRLVENAAAGRGVQVRVDHLFHGVDAMETPADSPVVHACESLTGCAAGAVNFATEGPFLAQLGTETVILGPGDIDQAHQPDEYVRADRLEPTVHLLRSLIQRFCTE